MNKKFLLIAFKFPPYAGVGGFRWSKLCKYLARLGHEVHVVTVHWRQHGANTHLADVQDPNIRIYRIPSGYPHNFKYRPLGNRYLNAFKNRVVLFPLTRYFFYDDEAQHWGRYLIPFCEKLLKEENIQVVIATGAPFQANRWAAVLKERNHQMRLIQDFRDEWIFDVHRSWPRSKIPVVKSWQKQAVETADCVVAVTKGLLELHLADTQQRNGYVISNGHDPNFKLRHGADLSQESEFSFIYIGNLRSGREEPLTKFLEAVRQVRPQTTGIKVILVGDNGRHIRRNFVDLLQNGILELRDYVSQETAFEMVRQCTYAVQLNARAYPYLVSTKVYEYGMLKVPTISFNYGGEIHDLIIDYDLGYSINVDTDDLPSFLISLYEQPQRQFSYNVEQFAYRNLAVQYSELING